MFTIKTGEMLKVHSASAFTKKDGTAGAVIILMENENQPENIERPSKSKSMCKIWLDKLPKGIVNGGYITLTKIGGIEWLHIPSTYHKGEYEDVVNLVGTDFKVYKPTEATTGA